MKIYFHFNLFVLTINDTKIFLDNYNCSITRKQFWGQIIYSTNISFFLSFFDLVKYDGFITYFFTQAMPFFWSDLQISFENNHSIKTKDCRFESILSLQQNIKNYVFFVRTKFVIDLGWLEIIYSFLKAV